MNRVPGRISRNPPSRRCVLQRESSRSLSPSRVRTTVSDYFENENRSRSGRTWISLELIEPNLCFQHRFGSHPPRDDSVGNLGSIIHEPVHLRLPAELRATILQHDESTESRQVSNNLFRWNLASPFSTETRPFHRSSACGVLTKSSSKITNLVS